MTIIRFAFTFFAAAIMLSPLTDEVQAAPQTQSNAQGYSELVQLFEDWRVFEQPPLRNGAPDYTAAYFAGAHKELKNYQARLDAIDNSQWPVAKKVDWQLVRAEMNGFDFNHRVLQPWVRDPAFYQTLWMAQSDVPAHEGPTNHAVLEVWTYSFPLSKVNDEKMAQELAVVPLLLEQACDNLTGNARDLWVAGINNFQQQSKDLQWLGDKVGSNASDAFNANLKAAKDATLSFIQWLEQQASNKTGTSGVGKAFVMKDFFKQFNDIGCIPVSMVQWEMTGNDSQP